MGVTAAPTSFTPTYLWVIVLNILFGMVWFPIQPALTTIAQLAVPDQKCGHVGSPLKAAVTANGLVSMTAASFLGDVIGWRELLLWVGVLIFFAGLLDFDGYMIRSFPHILLSYAICQRLHNNSFKGFARASARACINVAASTPSDTR